MAPQFRISHLRLFFKQVPKGLPIYILLTFLIFLSLRELCHQVNYPGFHDFIHQLRSWADAMFFAFPILFLKKKRFVFPYLVLLNLYFLSIIWYFQVYGNIMPCASYLMLNNLPGTMDSILSLIAWKDLIIIWPSILFSILYTFIERRYLSSIHRYASKNLWIAGASFIIISLIISAPYWPNKRPSWDQPIHIYNIIQLRGLKEYGILNFWIYQIASHQSVTPLEKETAIAFIKRHHQERNTTGCDSLSHKKNLILILVESMQSWATNLTIEGIEVTPHISKLLKEPGSIYFPNVLSQVKDGRSSDAQLIINTGLLPLKTGATSSLCSHNTYLSLANALKEKGYTSASFLCDEKSFWNQEAAIKAYGFDELHDRLAGDIDKKTADEMLFTKGLPLLKTLKPPFYTQWVTCSSHMPYPEPLMQSPLENLSTVTEEVRNYLISLQYVDKCISAFLDNLKKENLYDNSIIIITGDHEQMTYNKYQKREQLVATDCFVPLIILNSPLSSRHTDKIFGQMDIYPSLLDIMGCCDYSWKGVGESTFSDSVSNYATYRTGLAAQGPNVSDSVKYWRKECWTYSDILLRMDYFKQ